MTSRIFAAAIGMLVLAGCQTVEGLGEDVESGGQPIQDVSNDVQDDI